MGIKSRLQLHIKSNHGDALHSHKGSINFLLPSSLFHNKRSVYHIWISNLNLTLDNDLIDTTNNAIEVDGITYYVPQGRPSIVDICNDLNSQITNVKFAYLTDRNKIKITNKKETTITVNFNIANSIYKVFGYGLESFEIPTQQNNICANMVNLRSPSLLYIKSNLGRSFKTEDEGADSVLRATNVLATIPVLCGSYEDVIYNDPDGVHRIITYDQAELHKLHFSIHDGYDDSLLKLKTDFHFTLMIEEHENEHEQIIQNLLMTMIDQQTQMISLLGNIQQSNIEIITQQPEEQPEQEAQVVPEQEDDILDI